MSRPGDRSIAKPGRNTHSAATAKVPPFGAEKGASTLSHSEGTGDGLVLLTRTCISGRVGNPDLDLILKTLPEDIDATFESIVPGA